MQRTLLDAIAYDVLGETHSRAIAAQVLLKVNEEDGVLMGLFDTNQTGLGKIKASTVLTSLQRMTNLKTLRSLRNARKPERLLTRQGFECVCHVDDIGDLCQAEVLIDKSASCLQHYFGFVAETFPKDWPKRGESKNSSFEYAKVIAALVRLLSTSFLKDAIGRAFARNSRRLRPIL